jgi:hypothetical protein
LAATLRRWKASISPAVTGLSVLLVPLVATAQVPVVTCGQVVESSGELVGDLDCPSSQNAVVIANGGSLALNGFTVSGSTMPVLYGSATIRCRGKCKVFGPGTVMAPNVGICADDSAATNGCTAAGPVYVYGHAYARGITISGSGTHGVYANKVRLDDVTIGNVGAGVAASRAKIRNATISNVQSSGISLASVLALRDSVITDNGGDGIVAGKAKIKDSIISNNAGYGFRVNGYVGNRKMRVSGSTISDNGKTGISASGITLISSKVMGNAWNGVSTKGLTVRDSTITSNGEYGVWVNGPKLAARRTSVADNCVIGSDSDCVDIAGCATPHLSDTTCNTSVCLACVYSYCPNGTGGNLGVCAAD